MQLTVYNISGAPRGWRVLLGLAIKHIDYDLRYLEGSKGEHQAPEFRKINPHGKVPVVVADGVARRESLSLLGWLDRRYPERPLFGKAPAESAKVWETATLLSDYLLEATNAVVSPVFEGDGTPPLAGSAEAEDLNTAVRLLRVEHALMQEILGDRPFLCGDEPTAADAVAYPDIARIMRALETRPDVMAAIGFAGFDDRFPVLAAWRDRMEALPGFARTVPPHWRESAGTERSAAMTTNSYARTIRVDATPDAVYQALTIGFEHWWTKPDRPLVKTGDIAKFSFAGRKGFWSFRARVLRPDRVELVCVEALYLHEGYPSAIETEWLGTTVIWQLRPDGDGTEIRFEHAGLTPDLHCFEICEAGWDRFFVGSLKAYLDTGRGAPFDGA